MKNTTMVRIWKINKNKKGLKKIIDLKEMLFFFQVCTSEMKIICIELWIVFTQTIKYWQSSHLSYCQFPIVNSSFKHIICTLSFLSILCRKKTFPQRLIFFQTNKYIYRVNRRLWMREKYVVKIVKNNLRGDGVLMLILCVSGSGLGVLKKKRKG